VLCEKKPVNNRFTQYLGTEKKIMSEKKTPISQFSGKLQAAGVLFVAAGIIMSVGGVWWGPAMLFPGVLLLIIGWF